MSGLLSDQPGGPAAGRRTCGALYVRGVRYATSAAKFWPSLIDEIRAGYPSCDRFELSAPGGGQIERRHLYPQEELAAELESLEEADLENAIRATLAELELFGPPPPVQIRLCAGEKELLVRPLPGDCVDADILPYLVAWPLTWAGIPEVMWGSELVSGSFTGTDRGRHRDYTLSFDLAQRHLSEGLYQRTFTVQAQVHSSKAAGQPGRST